MTPARKLLAALQAASSLVVVGCTDLAGPRDRTPAVQSWASIVAQVGAEAERSGKHFLVTKHGVTVIDHATSTISGGSGRKVRVPADMLARLEVEFDKLDAFHRYYALVQQDPTFHKCMAANRSHNRVVREHIRSGHGLAPAADIAGRLNLLENPVIRFVDAPEPTIDCTFYTLLTSNEMIILDALEVQWQEQWDEDVLSFEADFARESVALLEDPAGLAALLLFDFSPSALLAEELSLQRGLIYNNFILLHDNGCVPTLNPVVVHYSNGLGGGLSYGSSCTKDWLVMEESLDGGITWFTIWEGWGGICV